MPAAGDGLAPERVLRALAHPVLGPQLHAVGVRKLSTVGGEDAYVPPGREQLVRQLVDSALAEHEGTPLDAAEDALDLGGTGYADDEISAAVELLEADMLGPRRLEKAGEMSYPRARRLSKWFTSDAAGWNEQARKLTAAPGYRWVKRKGRKGERRWHLRRT
jgi:hypothetical protein